MGLREKVALILTVTFIVQIISAHSSFKSKTPKSDYKKHNQKRSFFPETSSICSKTQCSKSQRLKTTESAQPSEISQEAIRKAFKFPDIEYPSAPFVTSNLCLQDTNIQKVQSLDSFSSNPLTSPTSYENKVRNNKKYNIAKLKATENCKAVNTYPEHRTTSTPICYREGLFPEVEYPVSVWEIWKPSYWPLTTTIPKRDSEANSYNKLETKLKSSKDPWSQKCLTKVSKPKSASLDKKKTNVTPAPVLVDTTESKSPNIAKLCDKCANTIQNEYKNEVNLENNYEFSSFYNGTLPVCIAAQSPYTSNDQTTFISQLEMYNDDKKLTVSSDSEIASLSDVTETVVFENTDNKYTCVDDNVTDVNKSSAFDVDEEFTTDAPDFDENIWSISMSTVSPLSVVDIDDAWANVVITDSYKPLTESDELEQCFITVP